MRWLADIKMAHPSQQIVLQEYIDTINQCTLRLQRLTEQIRQLLPQWRLFPVVQALQSLRGVSLIVAVTTVAEIGDYLGRSRASVASLLRRGLRHLREHMHDGE